MARMHAAWQSMGGSRLGCWWPRKYLWLNEGFFCPEHDKVIEEGIKIGAFNDWPLDTSPEVLEYQEATAEFHDIDTPEGQAILDEAGHG